MADMAKFGLTKFGECGHLLSMDLKFWRTGNERSQGECASVLGLEGGARSYQRIETGENKADADLVERIIVLTQGAVTAVDMHGVRLAWLRENRPDKKFSLPQPQRSTALDDFDADAGVVAGPDRPSQAGAGAAFQKIQEMAE